MGVINRKGRGEELTDRLDAGILNEFVFCGVEMFFPKRSELNMVKVMTKVVWSDPVGKKDWGKNWGKYRYGLAFQAFDRKNLNGLNMLFEETGDDD